VTSSLASELWQLMLLYGVVLTIGATIVSGFAISALLVPWFPHARGRILGLVEAGNPVGTLLFVPLAQLLVSTIGWQETFRVLGLVFLRRQHAGRSTADLVSPHLLRGRNPHPWRFFL
jgi:OFA family oxalate/formate antiporter-like MFS transporter